MLAFESLLAPLGFVPTGRIKLVRHQDSRYDLDALIRAGQFDYYQEIQKQPRFHDTERLVTFLGRPGNQAVFFGVYDVMGVTGPADHQLPEDFLYPELNREQHYRYTLRHDARFDEMKGRLVIDWGAGTRSWTQNFKPGTKAVVELLPLGYVRDFPGFMEVVLTFDELVSIVQHPTPHRDWHRMLGSVAGVYLILDTGTGRQYVGSAYGERGLLGRWASYAATGHGGNAQLIELLAAEPGGSRRFQFSILQTLPLTLTAKEVVAVEIVHKRKLGSRAHGLNSN